MLVASSGRGPSAWTASREAKVNAAATSMLRIDMTISFGLQKNLQSLEAEEHCDAQFPFSSPISATRDYHDRNLGGWISGVVRRSRPIVRTSARRAAAL